MLEEMRKGLTDTVGSIASIIRLKGRENEGEDPFV